MGVIPQIRLIDGPVVQVSHSELVKRMAADLVRFDAAQNHRDAIRCLFACGVYKSVDIAHLVDDARQVAVQPAFAAEISKP